MDCPGLEAAVASLLAVQQHLLISGMLSWDRALYKRRHVFLVWLGLQDHTALASTVLGLDVNCELRNGW